jgi:purine-binding chemotaxis protein CheW
MEPNTNKTGDQILVFSLDEQLFAFPLQTVVKVIHALEIRPLPDAPEIICGIINVKGRIIPVADIRKRLNMSKHEIEPGDCLIIANTGIREIAIQVDAVSGIRELSAFQFAQTSENLPFAKHINGVAKLDDGLILIYRLEEFLNLKEEKELERALKSK